MGNFSTNTQTNVLLHILVVTYICVVVKNNIIKKKNLMESFQLSSRLFVRVCVFSYNLSRN
jgi:hypothetical protein